MDEIYDIGISPDGTYLFARHFRHAFNAKIAFELAGDLIGLGRDLDVVGCLVDIRGTKSVSSVVDKYEFANVKAPGAGLPFKWRYAFLVDAGDRSHDVIDDVMKNAGYKFQIFRDEETAVRWLCDAGPVS